MTTETNAETSADAGKREAAQRAYHALFSRTIQTPGLNIKNEFNEQPSRQGSVNQLLHDAGYSLEQRELLMSALSRANKAGVAIEEGRLRDAGFHRGNTAEALAEIRDAGLLSTDRLGAMSADVEMMIQRIDEKRPGRYQDAQTFFAGTVANGTTDEEASKRATQKLYETLLDSGLDPEQASKGYHALQDALAARKLIATMTSGEPVVQPLAELSQSIKVIAEAKPPVLDATNLQTLRDLEKTLTDKHLTPAASLLGNGRILSEQDVTGNFTIDPAQARETAPDRLEKLQAVLDWYEKKNQVHSMGAFYGYVFKNAPDAIKAIKDAQNGDGSARNDVALVKAVERAEELLGIVSKDFRTQSAQQVVKTVDDLRESQFKTADQVADLVGVLPVVGPRAKFLIKETAIGLRYASGDISGTEAITSTVKEAASAVVGDAIFKDKVLDKFSKSGEDLLFPLATAIGGNVLAEVGKVVGQNKLSDISAEKLVQAVNVGIAKGVVEGGFKIAEKLKLGDDRLDEFMKTMVKIAQKFGVERPVDQMIDQELKSRSRNGKSYSMLEDGGSVETDARQTGTRDGEAGMRKALAALAAMDDGTRPRAPGEADNIAAALTLAANRGGLRQIDAVVPSSDGSRLIAIQGDERSEFSRTASVAIREAAKVPAEESQRQIAQSQSGGQQPSQAEIETRTAMRMA
ncbi:XVIPCD domain-containing protein [Lysobacter hankyongensis]|uniref:X-Tfes XVIPCD domain-containing protein n=1 Tax=Lysobacter hankyongensis TaxID=1176535 RepID=A0ABP9C3H1_9GAMM